MGWSDQLKDLAGRAGQGGLPSIIGEALGTEGLQSILTKLQGAGLGTVVASWLDKNKGNLPISQDQLRAALGDQHVQDIARSLGIPVDGLLDVLAQQLPHAVGVSEPPTVSGPNS